MKSTFKITYRHGNGDPTYLSRLIEAESASEAQKILGPCHSIRSISVQCAGMTQKNEPCQRFTHDEYCCDAHDPRSANAELSFDEHAELFYLDRIKGTKCYFRQELDIATVREAFEKNEMTSRYPRTQKVDRLISLNWDPKALRDFYEHAERERMTQYRRENFRLKVVSRKDDEFDDADLSIDVATNGRQWWCTALTFEEAAVLQVALAKFVKRSRHYAKHNLTGKIELMYGLNGEIEGGES